MKEPVITSGLREVLDILRWRPVSAILSIESPGMDFGRAPRVAEHGFGDIPQKIIAFSDAGIQRTPEGRVLRGSSTLAKVEEGLSFIFGHAARGNDAVLVHCAAGLSRSTAMALGALALLHPGRDEDALVRQLLRVEPRAKPNLLVAEQADLLTGRDGRLVKAVLDSRDLRRNGTNRGRRNRTPWYRP